MGRAGQKPLNTNMLKCIELMVYTDLSKGEICNQLGVAPNSISRWFKREDFQQEYKDEMHRGFNTLASKAQKKLERLIDSPNDGVALGACREVLNKAGYQETQKIEQTLKEITVEVVD